MVAPEQLGRATDGTNNGPQSYQSEGKEARQPLDPEAFRYKSPVRPAGLFHSWFTVRVTGDDDRNCSLAKTLANQSLKEQYMATTMDSRRETASLIGSDKVEGTAVYGADDRKIGTVQRAMIDKISGKVMPDIDGYALAKYAITRKFEGNHTVRARERFTIRKPFMQDDLKRTMAQHTGIC